MTTYRRDGEPHYVYKHLPALIEQAAKQQRSGYSVDIRIYARQDQKNGGRWGGVSFLNRAGQLIDEEMPLSEPEHVAAYVAEISRQLFARVISDGDDSAGPDGQ